MILTNPLNNEQFEIQANVIADLNNITEEQWHELRAVGLGGSDAGACVGLNKYKSKITLFLEKMGRIEKFRGNKHTEFGKRLEPVIREWFQESYSRFNNTQIKAVELDYMFKHNEYNFIRANLDGIVYMNAPVYYGDNGKEEILPSSIGGIEIKTADISQRKFWVEDEVPESYYCQMQHYMIVTGLQWMIIVVLIGKDLIWKLVPKNEEFCEQILESEKDFWLNYVQKDVCPEPDGNDNTTESLNQIYKFSNEESVERFDLLEKRNRYKELNKIIKEAEKEQKEIKQELMLEMGENETFVVDRIPMKSKKGEDYFKDIKITWKNQSRPVTTKTPTGEKKIIRVMRIQ